MRHIQQTYRVRVQTYVRKPYLILYILLITALLVVDLWVVNDAPVYSDTHTNWWYFDIPWFFFIIAGWLPTFQTLHYRKTFVSAKVDTVSQNCRVLNGRFAGEWNIKKGYPRHSTSTQASALLLLIFVLILFVAEVTVFFHVWINPSYVPNTASKVNSVQGFFIPIILSSILARTWSSWRYPKTMVLTQPGKRLSIQYKDDDLCS